MSAYGVAAAISQAIGGRKTKALERFASAVRPQYGDDEPRRPTKQEPLTSADYHAGIKKFLIPEAA